MTKESTKDTSYRIYLDILRVVSAVMVVIHHAKVLKIGPLLFLSIAPALGHQFVIVFFVLSGYVIAATVDRKQGSDLKVYALDRISRIYSVCIPALGFSIVISIVIASAAGQVAAGAGTPWQLLAGVLSNVFPVGQSWDWMIVPPDNPPFWSLCYEMIFYAVFGTAHYLRGARRAATIFTLFLLAGPKVLLLFPCWLAGVALFHYRDARQLSKALAWIIAIVVPLTTLGAASYFRLSGKFAFLTKSAFGEYYPSLSMSDSFAFDYVLASCVAVHLYGMRNLPIAWPGRVATSSANLATVGFSIYLLHYPLWLLFGALLPNSQHSWPTFIGAVLAMGAITWTFAYLTEWRRPLLRRSLARWFEPKGLALAL